MAASKDFFISRAGADKEVAAWIVKELQKVGLSCVVQDRDFRIGEMFPRSIDQAFENCRAVITLLSPSYVQSRYCMDEWYTAYALDRQNAGQLLPIRIAAGPLPPLAMPIAYINLIDIDSEAAKAAKLHAGVAAFRQGGKLPDALEPDTKPKTNSNFETCFFSGREDELAAIHSALWADDSKWSKTAVLYGLPGVGKSTAAREYTRRHLHRYCGAWLVRSETETTLLADLADLAPALNTGLRVNDNIRSAARVSINEAQTLARQTGKPFLFVFDNVEAPKDLPDWTRGEGLHRLVSSRYGTWPKNVKAIEIESLSADASRELLLESANRQPEKGVEDLLKCLGGHPLAIAQAGAYLRENPSETFAAYAAQHQKRMGEAPDDWPQDQQLVAATFKPSIERAASKAPEAPTLLRRASFFASENIPLVLLTEHPDGDETKKAADALLKYSLWRMGEHGTFDPTRSVHRLLQSVLHGDISQEEKNAEAAACADRLSAIFTLDPEDPRHWATVKPLSSHAAALGEKTPDAAARPNLARVLNAAGVYFMQRADYSSAEPVLRRALEIDKRHHGDDHPIVAGDLVSLGRFLTMTDKFEEAEKLLRRALEIDEKHNGPEHPSVARDLFHLGRLLHEADRFDDAEKALRRALEIDEKTNGASHPDVARDLVYLGKLLQDHDKFEEAEAVLRRAVAIDEQQNDPSHPYLARDLMNFAELLQKKGHVHEAEPLMRRALQLDEAQHGESHPYVARDLVSLGRLLWDDDRYAEAEPPLRRALEIDERVQGPTHTDVARDLICLARVLRSQDKFAEAEPLMRRALEIDEKRHGDRHTDVARDLIALAKLLAEMNRFDEAEPLMKRALAIDERQQGRGHTDVARDLIGLADVLLSTGRGRDAEPLARRALGIDEARFGPEDDEVARDLNLLGRVLTANGRAAEAEPALRRALAIDEKMHEHDHADVSRDLDALAEVLLELGQLDEAERAARRAVDIAEKVQGADHSDVARHLLTLARVLHSRGRRKDAEPLAARAESILKAKNHPDAGIASAHLGAIRRGAPLKRVLDPARPPPRARTGLATAAFNIIFGAVPPKRVLARQASSES